ncbi:MAG: hypothetical protein IPL39_14505 [Opitutaceae bacterium]|nr:hypothetical protein [Opitutaceae bacterium]
MTDRDRQTLHQLFLVGLRRAGERGFTAFILATHARSELGLELTEERATAELRQLSDRKLVAPLQNPLTGTRWIITETGEQTLASAGL